MLGLHVGLGDITAVNTTAPSAAVHVGLDWLPV